MKILNRLAAARGLARIAENAGKPKVEQLIASIRHHVAAGNAWPGDDEAEFDRAVAAYVATWPAREQQSRTAPTASAADPAAPVAQEDTTVSKPMEWKFTAVQATYNCTTGDWASTDECVQKNLFERMVAFSLQLGTFLGALGISVTLEWSTRAMEHLHMHVYMHLAKAFHRKGADALDAFVFEGISPHLKPNRASGKSYAGAVHYGHFYVYVDKIGSVKAWSNFRPFESYGVEGWWLDNEMKKGNLTREVYLKWAARVGIGFQRRLGDMKAAERYEKEQAAVETARKEAASLMEATLPVKTFPEVEKFLSYFERTGRWFRRPMLAIIGGTNLGKSVLAADVLRRVGLLVNAPGFLEITVESNAALDLAEFDVQSHSGVLLDGVGDAQILKVNRESLQGRAKVSKGGQSATNMYAYKYTLARRAVVATFDLSAVNLDQFVEDHWLSCDLNVICLHLTEKAFVEPAAVAVLSECLPSSPPASADSGTAPASPRPSKRRWVGSPSGHRR